MDGGTSGAKENGSIPSVVPDWEHIPELNPTELWLKASACAASQPQPWTGSAVPSPPSHGKVFRVW